MKYLLIIIIFTIWSCSAHRDRLPEKDDPLTIEEIVRRANSGKADDQFTLGCIYYHGEGVERDCAQAIKWFRESAEQGNAEAQFFLGEASMHGYGTEKNNERAIQWLTKSAEQGNVNAQTNLAAYYSYGVTIKRDLKKAFGWNMKAAEQGHPGAQWLVGMAYGYGIGTGKDPEKALTWLYISLMNGKTDSANNVETQIRGMETSQITKCWKAARKWFLEHITQCSQDWPPAAEPPHPQLKSKNKTI